MPVMDKTYLERRRSDNFTSYRMNKRKETIVDSLRRCLKQSPNRILDIGTADGRILSKITNVFNVTHAIGIDLSKDAAMHAVERKDGKIKVFLGDCTNLPFKDKGFDILMASAVLEHIENTDSVLKEAHRVLKKDGLLCITLPNPFYDYINSKLAETYHVKRFTMRKMEKILHKYGFEINLSKYFMVWPFGEVPFIKKVENTLNCLNLGFFLFNYIIVGKKV